jgi:glucose-fructose oxidoreductase
MNQTRRSFIRKSALLAGGIAAGSGLMANPNFYIRKKRVKEKLGIALVGLGYYSTDILAPRLLTTEHCCLAGIVTGTPAKEKIWMDRYNIPRKNVYNYENYDEIAHNDDIDIIYIVLPNSMHAEYTIRAARAGKHVICEKPMALSVQECRSMIDACSEAGVALSVGYRLHFEPTTQEIMKWGRDKEFGKINYVHASAGFTWPADKTTNWKLQRSYGGGPLMDMGVYSLQAARYSTREEPVSATGQQFKPETVYFKEVPETVTFQLEFPSGAVANLSSSFGNYSNELYVSCSEGWFQLNPFSGYGGIRGQSSRGEINFPEVDQQASQMDEVALCIKEGKPLRVSGEEGLADLRVIEAIQEAIYTGKKISV